uniref:Ionotropic glutamate receptor C-terminal domain-containing protein n=1 Tax=Megaselia scalaris TaxID=36166 RepID=T1H3L3_MEGSC
DPIELENQFSIGNSLWFTIGALLQQGSEVAPKAPSTRTVASAWWFFQLIIVASWGGGQKEDPKLFSFMDPFSTDVWILLGVSYVTLENQFSIGNSLWFTIGALLQQGSEVAPNPINDVEDLANNKGDVQYGAKASGSTRNFFAKADYDTYKKMNEYMEKNPDLLVPQNGDGVQKVLNENYAFLMESTSIEYQLARLCNLTQVGGLLDEKGYGIAMRKSKIYNKVHHFLKKVIPDWPYRSKFNEAIIDFQESGVLTKMKNKWWNEVGTSGC